MDRATAPPTAQIDGFQLDDDGDWVATLACGHRQHVRHRPPWQLRPWVLTEHGRADKIGQSLACPACLMPRLPPDVHEYKRTPVFDERTVPAGLLKSHQLKRGTWGQITVLSGRVLYVIEPDHTNRDAGDVSPGVGAPAAVSLVLSPQLPGIIAPEQPHHVSVQTGGQFFVGFMRQKAP